MIAKLSTGNGFGGATSYLLRNGESDKERAKVKVLAASGVDFSIDKNGNIVLDARQAARDFRFQAMMMPSVRKPVYDIALSWRVGEHVPSDEKLARTEEFLQMIGFGNTQYIIVEHEKENEHSHAIANIVDNDGNRISTKDLIDRMHAAAREITKKYGYQWGDTAKKETIEKAHKPHEKARYSIEPTVKQAVSKASNISELPDLLKSSGIGCNIKYSEAGKPVGISFSVEQDGQLHTFRGSDLDRSLSAGNIVKNIESRLAQEEQANIQKVIEEAKAQECSKAKELREAYRKMAPTIKELDETVIKAFELYRETKEAGFAISVQTNEKYAELRNSWAKFRELNNARNSAQTTKELSKAIGGMLMLLNPIAGLLVMAVGSIAADIRMAAIKTEKQTILSRIEKIESDIDNLKTQKIQNNIEREGRLDEYLQAKDARREFQEGMDAIKTEIHKIRIQELKRQFPFKEPGHIMYIIHGPMDASIFHCGEDSKRFRKKNIRGGTFDDDRIEAARLMLKNKGYMVASDRGPDGELGFYEQLLNEQINKDFRVGSMLIQPDGKIVFDQEKVFGKAEKTEPILAPQQKPVQAIKKTEGVKKLTQNDPVAKPQFEIVWESHLGIFPSRIIRNMQTGLCKLQNQEPGGQIVNGVYTERIWKTKGEFSSFSDMGKDANYNFLQIKNEEGKIRYINQYGCKLTEIQMRKIGLRIGKGGRSI